MLSVLTRFLILIFLAFLVAYISLANWGADWAIASALAVLAIPLMYSYINLARLRRHVLQDTVENMPLPSGFWEEVFFRL